jgi:hypothetical protein
MLGITEAEARSRLAAGRARIAGQVWTPERAFLARINDPATLAALDRGSKIATSLRLKGLTPGTALWEQAWAGAVAEGMRQEMEIGRLRMETFRAGVRAVGGAKGLEQWLTAQGLTPGTAAYEDAKRKLLETIAWHQQHFADIYRYHQAIAGPLKLPFSAIGGETGMRYYLEGLGLTFGTRAYDDTRGRILATMAYFQEAFKALLTGKGGSWAIRSQVWSHFVFPSDRAAPDAGEGRETGDVPPRMPVATEPATPGHLVFQASPSQPSAQLAQELSEYDLAVAKEDLSRLSYRYAIDVVFHHGRRPLESDLEMLERFRKTADSCPLSRVRDWTPWSPGPPAEPAELHLTRGDIPWRLSCVYFDIETREVMNHCYYDVLVAAAEAHSGDPQPSGFTTGTPALGFGVSYSAGNWYYYTLHRLVLKRRTNRYLLSRLLPTAPPPYVSTCHKIVVEVQSEVECIYPNVHDLAMKKLPVFDEAGKLTVVRFDQSEIEGQTAEWQSFKYGQTRPQALAWAKQNYPLGEAEVRRRAGAGDKMDQSVLAPWKYRVAVAQIPGDKVKKMRDRATIYSRLRWLLDISSVKIHGG